MSAPRLHIVKTWPSYFAAVVDGSKPFELRRNDRDYAVGDVLRLVEWDPAKMYGSATGRALHVRVTYLAQGVFDLPAHLCVMGIERIDRSARLYSSPLSEHDGPSLSEILADGVA